MQYVGWQKHLHLVKEATWGDPTGAPLYLPFAEYDVKARPQAVRAALFTGLRQRRHQRLARATLSGRLDCPFYSYHAQSKSLAEHLWAWLVSAPNGTEPDSYAAVLFEAGTDNKRHLGLRPSSGILGGSAADGSIRLSIELMGLREEGIMSVPTLDPAGPRPTEFLFKDCELEVGGETVAPRSFELRINNNLQANHNNSYWPSLLTAGPREVEFRVSLFKADGLFDAMRRTPPADTSATLTLRGLTDGTAGGPSGQTVMTIEMNRLAFSDATDSGGLAEPVSQDIEFAVLKPVSTDDDLVASFSLA